MPSHNYLIQLQRSKRYLARLYEDDRYNTSIDFQDDLLSFFLHCNNIKEWVFKSDKPVIDNADEVEKLKKQIKKSLYLKICNEIAVDLKHCNLNRKDFNLSTDGHGSQTVEIEVTINEEGKPLNTEKKATTFNFFIQTPNGQEYNGLELAQRCIDEWDRILKENKLPVKG